MITIEPTPAEDPRVFLVYYEREYMWAAIGGGMTADPARMQAFTEADADELCRIPDRRKRRVVDFLGPLLVKERARIAAMEGLLAEATGMPFRVVDTSPIKIAIEAADALKTVDEAPEVRRLRKRAAATLHELRRVLDDLDADGTEVCRG